MLQRGKSRGTNLASSLSVRRPGHAAGSMEKKNSCSRSNVLSGKTRVSVWRLGSALKVFHIATVGDFFQFERAGPLVVGALIAGPKSISLTYSFSQHRAVDSSGIGSPWGSLLPTCCSYQSANGLPFQTQQARHTRSSLRAHASADQG